MGEPRSDRRLPRRSGPGFAALGDAVGRRTKRLRGRPSTSVGVPGAFRRSGLAALDVANLEEHSDRLRAHVRRSRTHQEGAGAQVSIVRGHDACPVAPAITSAPVLRPVTQMARATRG
jgi:hypothetical protein